jgi:threo-3-hydroxy-L-aspartate ammonia-lyase
VAVVSGLPITARDVEAAAERLAGVAHRTPVLRSRTLDAHVGAAAVHLKAEGHQRTGSFKFRGAYNKLATLSPEDRARGVAAVSSGNHAQAVALAARLHGCAATILMPEDAPASKTAATRGYGAEVVTYDRYASDREDGFAELCAERDLTPVHPFDDPAVMAGQGTAALELVEDAGPLDLLVVCVGGGGLISGCATIAADRLPGVRVVGVEPEAGDDFRRSLEAGKRVGVAVPRTIADGQATPMPGELTFAVVERLVDSVVTVSDDEIRAAMRFLFERCKVVAEPSGACALAALLAGRIPDTRAARVGVTLSGGNVDTDRFARVLAGGN